MVFILTHLYANYLIYYSIGCSFYIKFRPKPERQSMHRSIIPSVTPNACDICLFSAYLINVQSVGFCNSMPINTTAGNEKVDVKQFKKKKTAKEY
jgi:hypothetical protein